MIVEYNSKYDEDIKNLLLELGEHISSIDKEGYNIITEEYREKYFNATMEDISKNNGKMFLMLESDKVIGLIIGIINNEETSDYDFKAPKRGIITEFVISKELRSNGYGTKLLYKMEEYLYSLGCESILLGAFAYNDKAINFYERNGYHIRMTDMIKVK